MGGIVRPSAFAVLRLITSSNFVGCSIGISAATGRLRGPNLERCTASRSSSSRLASISEPRIERPVTLPPGRARVSAIPTSTGSVPGTKVAGALLHAANPAVAIFRQTLERTAVSLGLELHVLEVQRPDEFEPTFARFAALRVQALFVIEDPVFVSATDLLARLSIKHRLPIVTGIRDLVRAGGFVSYGVDRLELWRCPQGRWAHVWSLPGQRGRRSCRP